MSKLKVHCDNEIAGKIDIISNIKVKDFFGIFTS